MTKLNRSRWGGCFWCDEPNGSHMASLYGHRYCRYCGRPLTEEAWAEMEGTKKVAVKVSKQYPWWPYIRYLVRKYPDWEKTPKEDLKLSERESDGFSAVKSAIELTERMNDGSSRLKVVQALHWDRAFTLEGAALSIPCGKTTAARWQKMFFEEVARKAGYL